MSESLRFNLCLHHIYRRILLFFCNTKISEILTWQNPEQLFVAQVLKKFNL